ncbi:cation:proton antiporter [Georgenia sp. MJ206]|uniref:cation:proton antiporter domain-containing protein n=1 Tax=Georgenia wangjunii TaxID=3117730 RepID=UPI002F265D35
MDVLLVVVGVLGVLVATLSARLERLPLSEPLIGLVAGVLAGPAVLGVLPWHTGSLTAAPLHEAARLLLAVSVMAVALRFPFGQLRSVASPVALLLAVAMPLMAAVTAGLAGLVLGTTVAGALLVGAALTPTDPVLSSNVVTGAPAEEDIPARVRRILSIESGANDGLALPLVLVAVAVAGPLTAGAVAAEIAWQVLGAVVVGVVLGAVGGWGLQQGEAHGATEPAPALLFTLLLALGVLGVCGVLGVSGVLGVFVAGLAFNRVSTGPERAGEEPIDDAVNRFAVLPLFVMLGGILPWREWAEMGWRGIVFAVAVLLVRRVPAVLLLRRPLRLTLPDAMYLGWFGPIGVAALLYLTMEADRLAMDPQLLAAGALVVALSTVVHGISATPGRALYRRATRRASVDA